jgi:hypothetical protein
MNRHSAEQALGDDQLMLPSIRDMPQYAYGFAGYFCSYAISGENQDVQFHA